jgi:ribosomal protein S18 acetylase RimI-like enzyme
MSESALGARKLSPTVRSRRMTGEEFAEWQGRAIEEYSIEVADARGLEVGAARKIAQQAHDRLLPEGLDSPGVHLVVGEDPAGVKVGSVWLGPNPDGPGGAWIYGIEVCEARRGEGWGRALMHEAERLARADGHVKLGLNVFGSNAVARSLYESLDYRAVSIQMSKFF